VIIDEAGEAYGRRSFVGYDRAFIEKPDGSRMVFVTLTSTGIKQEGAPYGGYYLTEELALDALDKAIQEWVDERFPGHIHWRKLPEARSETFFEEDFDSPGWAERKLKAKPLWIASCRLAVDTYIHTNTYD